MDRDKLKVMIKDLKNVVNALESEIYSDTEAYKPVSYTHLTLPTILLV